MMKVLLWLFTVFNQFILAVKNRIVGMQTTLSICIININNKEDKKMLTITCKVSDYSKVKEFAKNTGYVILGSISLGKSKRIYLLAQPMSSDRD